MAVRFVMPYQTAFLDTTGRAAPGSKLNFYVTETSTRKNTYSDQNLTTPNANPVVANSAGRFSDIFLEAGLYKVVLTDSSDVVIWTADPVGDSLENLTVTGTFAIDGILTPSQITADQNNYNPTGLASATTLRLSTDAARNVTGLSGGARGRIIGIRNVGSFNLILKDESASSTAANRFALFSDIILQPDQVAILQYDSVSSRWFAIAGPENVLSGSVALTGDISPSQITANQNDYNPTGLSNASTLRLSTDASRDITGLSGGADGRVILIHNVGSNNIVLKDESSSSSAANRFALNADITIGADQGCVLQYDSTSSRWRSLANPTPAPSIALTKSYDSGNQTITLGSSITLAHGLGGVPKVVFLALVNVTTEHGYAVGEQATPTQNDSARQITASADATNVYIRISGNAPMVHNAGSLSTCSNITPANWRAVARAYA